MKMIQNYLSIISNTPLFDSVNNSEINDLLDCMNAHIEEYNKGKYIFFAGDEPSGIGIILQGNASILKEDIFGNRTIVGKLDSGDIFGEVFACALVDELPVSVEADTHIKVLLMDYKKIITTCSSNCKFHNTLIKNMLKILAKKNMYLNNKNDILASKTIRDKLMKFFKTIAKEKNNLSFDIPYDRQELADFLGINRSAMTRELIKMKDDELIDFTKNHFRLID